MSIYDSEPFLIANTQTDLWILSVKQKYAITEKAFQNDLALVNGLKTHIEPIPEWGLQVRADMPDWGREPCSPRWLDGLEALTDMIATETFYKTPAGRCGDVPGSIPATADRYTTSVERWLNSKTPAEEPDRSVSGWLGNHTLEKEEAARCFVEVVRGAFFQPGEEWLPQAHLWRERAEEKPILAQLFYGDGLDGGLQSLCAFQTVRRLERMIRLIGGDDTQLAWTRWWCNTQLRNAWNDDPLRIEVTLGYLWGWHAYLVDQGEAWLRSRTPESAGAALVALQKLSRCGDKTLLRRWLVGSLLATTKHWYGRMLNFIDEGQLPEHLRHTPDLQELAWGV